jgi:hypothetical protein
VHKTKRKLGLRLTTVARLIEANLDPKRIELAQGGINTTSRRSEINLCPSATPSLYECACA